MKETCLDCKYCTDNKCTHINALYCKNAELWTPKWYEYNNSDEIDDENIDKSIPQVKFIYKI